MATVLSKIVDGKWGEAFSDAGNYLEDNPWALAAVVGLGGYALAGGFASSAAMLPAGSTVAGAGSASVASTFPMAGVASSGGVANTLFGTPAAQYMTGTGIGVLGSYLSAKAAAEDAARIAGENRDFSREMFDRQLAAGKVSYTPQTPSGLIAAKKRTTEPLSATPVQALKLRRAGVL